MRLSFFNLYVTSSFFVVFCLKEKVQGKEKPEIEQEISKSSAEGASVVKDTGNVVSCRTLKCNQRQRHH